MWRVTGIAVARNEPGRLALVATAGNQGARDAVWHLADPGSTGWSSLGDPPGGTPEFPWSGPARPAVAANADGRFEVVAIGSDGVTGAVWHAWQLGPDAGWSDWKSLETPPGHETVDAPPALARNKDGRLELFVVSRNVVWHRWQQEAGHDRWAAWDSLGGPGQQNGIEGPPTVAQNKDGRLELFVTAGDGAVWHRWQTAASNGWSGWESFNTPGERLRVSGPPAVAQNVDGRLELFVTASDGSVWHRWQTAASNGWSGWRSLDWEGAGSIAVAAIARPSGPMVLVGVPTDGGNPNDLWTKEQDGPNNAWQPWKLRAGLLGEDQLEPGQFQDPTLTLLPDQDVVQVVLLLRMSGQVSLQRVSSPFPNFWRVDPWELQPPPETMAAPGRPGQAPP